jgi:hypothetical protein
MKRVLLFAICLLFAGCSSPKKDDREREGKLQLAVKAAEESRFIEAELFLGFKFGMSKDEIGKHLSNLMSQGEIYLNEKGKYQYDFIDKHGIKYYFNFTPEYYDEKLYKMIYHITSALHIADGNEYYFIRDAFGHSDRMTSFHSFITKDVTDEAVYTCIKDNLVITFKSIAGSVMIYENAPISKIIRERRDAEIERKSKKSSSNF